MGSAEFAVPVLEALVAAGHGVVAVYCQPPRPAGRGQRPRPGPVHAFAESHGLPVRTPTALGDRDVVQEFAQLAADAAVVVAYGLLLPGPILDAPRLGCLNVHASLLPRWRGAAPIQRAILAGDEETGVTVMAMDQGLDTGDILASARLAIAPTATADALHDALAALGAKLTVEVLGDLAADRARRSRQSSEGVTMAPKLRREEGHMDWRRPAVELERALRALNPWPGTWFGHGGQRIKALRGTVAGGDGMPGTVLDRRLTVACGVGALRLTRVQRPGRSAADAGAFLRGYPLPPGTVLS